MKLSIKKIAIIALLHAISFSCKGMEKMEEMRVLYYKDGMYTIQKQIIKPDSPYAMPIPVENPKSGEQRNKQAPDTPKKESHWAQRIIKPGHPATNQPYRPLYTLGSATELYKNTQEAIQNLNQEKSELLTQYAAALNNKDIKKAVCITDQIRELDKKIANKEKVRMAAEKLLTVLEKKQKPTSGEEQKVPARRLSLTPSLQGLSPEVFTPPAPDLSKLSLIEEHKSS